MTVQQWIDQQPPTLQMEIWKRISHFLNNRELMYIMQGVSQGRELMALHNELNLFEKYQIDMLRMMDIIRHRFPEEVIMEGPDSFPEESRFR
ncbi:hypothetical protein [Oceanispirochaeta sp.]|jgi:hypothetical protein|uniref:hypothetical protein n=1 Tax=Oceanispirochaeta sp. TaxID=2035350 RepID=UPI002610EC75|nr:hypothetical protein [Oceanispirochaeta sp.]MDA3958907.1 hypothetical protein [Oceanispirochaeta sp.]